MPLGKHLGLLALLALASSVIAQAQARYYVTYFGAQNALVQPRFSHTFATFSEAVGDGADVTAYQVSEHTISWLPRTLSICAFCGPEAGANLTLKQSLDWSIQLGLGLSQWGPFEIGRTLYDRAMAQIERLRAGQIGYVMLDGQYRPWVASNCIHAVSDIDMDQGLLDTGAERGERATHLVALHLRRWMLGDEPAAWVGEKLGLAEYPIQPHEL